MGKWHAHDCVSSPTVANDLPEGASYRSADTTLFERRGLAPAGSQRKYLVDPARHA